MFKKNNDKIKYASNWEMFWINRYYRVRGLDPAEIMAHADKVADEFRAKLDAEERQDKLNGTKSK